MRSRPTYFRARHVATMTKAGVIDDGCVAVADGRIVSVGPTRDIKPPRVDVDHPGLLTPGLINVHTHLELTNVPRPANPGTFQDWLLTTMGSMRTPDLATFERHRVEAVTAGVAQCLKFGVTCVGDISQNVNVVRPVLAKGPIRSISYGECLGLGPRRERFMSLLRDAVKPLSGDRMRIGVSPHAPYTVDGKGYAMAYRVAQEAGMLFSTHLAETLGEADFVYRRSGPFMRLYDALGFDPGPAEIGSGSIIEWMAGLVPDDHYMGTLAHVNDLSPGDIERLADHEATVAHCPRTHAYFGRPHFDWKALLDNGVLVCVATDSCASSPDLNVMDDLRLLRQQSPEWPAEKLWSMVTTNATMGFDFGRGAFSNGQLRRLNNSDGFVADLVAWPTTTDRPLEEVLDTVGMLPGGVWIAGEGVSGST